MGLPGILGQIVEKTLEDVRERAGRVSRRALEEEAARRSRRRREFGNALRRPSPGDPVRFVCELKRQSPSKGILREDLDPVGLAAVYREHGARAVSVVTEPHFFGGSLSFLEGARRGAEDLPLLRKDFHVHELQVLETAASEADALLLLVSALSPVQLKDYLDIAREFALEHLVEAADLREAEVALKAGAGVVGVNNRDLATFDVDPGRTFSVLPLLQEANVVSVAESGIGDRDTVVRFQEAGVDALLVGEALVTSEDPGARLRELRGEGGDEGRGIGLS